MDKLATAKDILNEYRKNMEELSFLKEQLEEMDSKLIHANSSSVIGKADNGGIKNYLDDYVSDFLDLEDEYKKRYNDNLKHLLYIKDLINSLEDVLEKRILFRYYCSEEKVSLYQISREFKYSYDHIKRKHSQAIKNLQIKIDKKKE